MRRSFASVPALLGLLGLLTPFAASAQLAGTYTVGTGGDYASLQAAFDALHAQGVSGPVALHLLSGTYTLTGTATLSLGTDGIDGAGTNAPSADRPITIQAQSGNATDVVLAYEEPSFNDTPILTLDGADFVTIRHLTFRLLGNNSARGILLQDTVRAVTIRDNVFEAPADGFGTYTMVAGAFHTGSGGATLDTVTVAANTFRQGHGINLQGFQVAGIRTGAVVVEGNTFETPRTGIQLSGFGAARVQQNTLSVARGSRIGISLQNVIAPLLTDNTVAGTEIGGFSAATIRCTDCDGAARILRNRIEITGFGQTGLQVDTDGGPGPDEALVANNLIYVTTAAGTFRTTDYALQVWGRNLTVAHNTAVAGAGSDANSDACEVNGRAGGTPLVFQNNLCIAEERGRALQLFNPNYVTADHNGYYTAGIPLAQYGAEMPATLADLQALGPEAHGVFAFPGFVDTDAGKAAAVLDLTPTSPWFDDAGTDLSATIATDIDGAARSATPSLGAIEYTSALTPIAPSTTLTVGLGGTYASLQDALDDLRVRGLDPAQTGTTTLAVLPDSLDGAATFAAFAGLDALRPLVLTSSTGSAGDAILRHTMPDDAADAFILRLLSPRHLTIEGLGFAVRPAAGALPTGRAIVIEGHLTALTLRQNDFTGLSSTNTTSGRLAAIYGLDLTSSDSLHIEDNAFSQGTGLYLDGADINPSFDAPRFGVRVLNNRFVDVGGGLFVRHAGTVIDGNTIAVTRAAEAGIDLAAVPAPQVTGNTVTMSLDARGAGLRCDGCNGPALIARNVIALTGAASTGMELRNSSSQSDPGLVVNNRVRITTAASVAAKGIALNSTTMAFYHNSVLVESPAAQSAALDLNRSGGTYTNNILAAPLRGNAVTYFGGFGSSLPDFDYNNLFAADLTIDDRTFGGVDYPTLDSLQRAGLALNARAVFPGFDAELRTDSPWLDRAGADLTGTVDEDAEGTPRSTTPSLGAFEYTSTLTRIPPGTTLRVGPAGDYATLGEALADLQLRGFDEAGTGTSTLALEAGTYDGPFTLRPIPGLAPDRPLALRGDGDTAADVVLRREATDRNDNYVLRLSNAAHLTVQDLTIQPLGATYGRGVELLGTMTDVGFERVVFRGPAPASASRDRALLYSAGLQVHDGLRIADATFASGGTGIDLATSNQPLAAAGLTIERTTFSDLADGIALAQIHAPEIDGNTFTGLTGRAVVFATVEAGRITANTVTAGQHGFNLIATNAVVEDNRIDVAGTGIQGTFSGATRIRRNTVVAGGTALQLGSAFGGTATGTGLVANNVLVARTLPGTFSTPVGLSLAAADVDVYHNSIHGPCRLFLFSGTSRFRNNICAVTDASPALEISGSVESDYNNLFTLGPVLAVLDGQTDLASLADLQAEGYDAHSISVYPAFTSATDLTTDSPWMDDAGTDLSAAVPEDIAGTARPATPSLGAYQYTAAREPFAAGTTLTVGSGGDYATPAEAVAALLTYGIQPDPAKAAAPVTIALQPGTYTGALTFAPINGAGPDRPARLTSSTGAAADVTIRHAATGATDNYVLALTGVQHLTVDHLTFEATGTDYGRVVLLAGRTADLTLADNVFTGIAPPEEGEASAPDRAVLLGSADATDAAWVPLDGLTLERNTFRRGVYGAWLSGRFDQPLPGLRVRDNTFEDAHRTGLALTHLEAPVIEGNHFPGTAGTALSVSNTTEPLVQHNTVALVPATGRFQPPTGLAFTSVEAPQITGNEIVADRPAGDGYTGLVCTDCNGATRLTGNLIRFDGRGEEGTFGEMTGLVLSSGLGGTGAGAILVANNVVAIAAAPGTRSTGLLVNGVTGAHLAHNSVALTGAQPPSAACEDRSNTNATWQNNICATEGGAYALLVRDLSSFASDYNAFYTGTGPLAGSPDGPLATLADLRAASGTDAHSIVVFPAFAGTPDLTTNSWWLDDEGTDLAALVPTDRNGVARPATPSLGAYQYTSTVTPLTPGTYPIGPGGTYPDLPAALEVLLSAGIDPAAGAPGEVVLALEPGTYDGQNYRLPEIPGASPEHPVVFTSTTDDSSTVTISYAAEHETDNYVFHLMGTDYVGFRSLTLRATGTTFATTLLVDGPADSVFIQRSVLSNLPPGAEAARRVEANEDDEADDAAVVAALQEAAARLAPAAGKQRTEFIHRSSVRLTSAVSTEIEDTRIESLGDALRVGVGTSFTAGEAPGEAHVRLRGGSLYAPNGTALRSDGGFSGSPYGTLELGDISIRAGLNGIWGTNVNRLDLENTRIRVSGDATGFGNGVQINGFDEVRLSGSIIKAPTPEWFNSGTLLRKQNMLIRSWGSYATLVQNVGTVESFYNTFRLMGGEDGESSSVAFYGIDSDNAFGNVFKTEGRVQIDYRDWSPGVTYDYNVLDLSFGTTLRLDGEPVSPDDLPDLIGGGSRLASLTLHRGGIVPVPGFTPSTLYVPRLDDIPTDVKGRLRLDLDPESPGNQTLAGAYGDVVTPKQFPYGMPRASNTMPEMGHRVDVSFDIENRGTETATDGYFRLGLDLHLGYIGAWLDKEPVEDEDPGPALRVPLGDLEPGASTTLTLGLFPKTDAFDIPIGGYVGSGGGKYEFPTGTVTLDPQPSDTRLEATKTAEPTSPAVGENVTFTIEVTNAGTTTATGVSVTDVLDPLLSHVSHADGCAFAAGTEARVVSCELGTLEPGASRTVSFTARVEQYAPSIRNALIGSGFADGAEVFFEAETRIEPRRPEATLAGRTSANTPHATSVADPINTFTGEHYFAAAPDLNLNGPLPLFFQRYYASLMQADGKVQSALGPNWSHTFDWRMTVDGSTAEVVSDRGLILVFARAGAEWVQQGNLNQPYRLVQDGAVYRLGDPRTQRLYTFDAGGRLVEIADGRGNALTLTYDAGDRLAEVTDGLGFRLTFAYDAAGRLTEVGDGTRSVSFGYTAGGLLERVTDARGHTTTYRYDLAHAIPGLLTAIVRPDGTTAVTQTYDAEGRVATQTDAFGHTTTLTYGADGTTTVTDALGHTRTDAYSPGGLLLSQTDRLGQTRSLAYDDQGFLTRMTDRLGATMAFAYDPATGRPTAITDARGGRTAFTYTPRTRAGLTFHDLTGLTLPDGTTLSMTYNDAGAMTTFTNGTGATWTFTYNDRGQPLTRTNPRGDVQVFTYRADGMPATGPDADGLPATFSFDAFRRLTGLTDAAGGSRTYTYDANDNLTAWTDARGQTRTYTYDENNRLTAWTDPAGGQTRYAYDAMDRLVETTDPLGRTTTMGYDALGRPTTLTRADGQRFTVGYDAEGRMTSMRNGTHTWTLDVDAEGILSEITSPLGLTTAFASNPMGQMTARTDAGGHTRTFAYDALGRLTGVQDPLGNSTTYAYDAQGRVTSATLPGGAAASYTYDALGRLAAVTGPGGQTWLFTTDERGALTQEVDPLGRTTTYTYDARRRVHRVTLPGGSGQIDLAYDATDHLTSLTYSDGTDISFTFDPNGQVRSATGVSLERDAAGRITRSNGLGLTYDAADRLTEIQMPPGPVSYAYDAEGRLATVTDWLGGTMGFTYDADGRLTAIARPNGLVTTYTRDADGRLTAITEQTGDSGPALAAVTLRRDARGDVVEATYDGLLPPAVAPASAAYDADAAGQVEAFAYDYLGRLTDDGRRSYTWNLASHLTASTADATTTEYTYDAFGLRTGLSRNGETQTFVWNYALGRPSVAIEQVNGADARYHVYTPGGLLLYSVEAATGRRLFYHYDDRGNVLLLTDDDGAVVGSYAYGPYGQVLAQDGTATSRFTFQGAFGVMDDGDDLYYLRARYYDARSGRFISPDPVRSFAPDALIPYTYALNNPLRYTDPSGLTPEPGRPGAPAPASGGSHRESARSPSTHPFVTNGGTSPGSPLAVARTCTLAGADIAPVTGSTVTRPTAAPDPGANLRPREELIAADPFFAAFAVAAEAHAYEANSIATGALNNVFNFFSLGALGDGCVAWRDWMMDWYNTTDADASNVLSFDPVSYWAGPFGHNFVRVTLRDGRRFILDPWRDPDSPIWTEEDYIKSIATPQEGSATLNSLFD